MKRTRALWIVAAGVLTLACAWSAGSGSPEAALARFRTHRGAEDQLMDPLILAGDRVVPLVLREVARKDMDRRCYAIGFLGNGSYRQALPVLERILADPTEADHYRADALQAIYRVDAALGTRYARRYRQRKDDLGKHAGDILAGGESDWTRRSYLDALLNHKE